MKELNKLLCFLFTLAFLCGSTSVLAAVNIGELVPTELKQKITDYQNANSPIDAVAILPNGQWIVTSKLKRSYSSAPYFLKIGIKSVIDNYIMSGKRVDAISFSKNGTWVVVAGNSASYSSNEFFNANLLKPFLTNLLVQKKKILSITTPTPKSWVVTYQGGVKYFGSLPSDLVVALNECVISKRNVQDVQINDTRWMLSADGWFASGDYVNPFNAASGFIALDYSIDRLALKGNSGWLLVSNGSRKYNLTNPLDKLESNLEDANGGKHKLSSQMLLSGVPGLSLAIVRNGKVDLVRTYGVKKVQTSDVVLQNTIFHGASISKFLAAATVVRLSQQNITPLNKSFTNWTSEQATDPNTPFGAWIQSITGYPFDTPEKQIQWDTSGNQINNVTLRKILQHLGGFSVHGIGHSSLTALPTTSNILLGQTPANNNGVPVVMELFPNSYHKYSGGGYTGLEALVEVVTGKKFPIVVKSKILDPFGMTESTMASLSAAETKRYAFGHPLANVSYTTVRECGGKAAGGLYTTARDYAKFVLEVLKSSANEPGGLSPDFAGELLTPGVVSIDVSRPCSATQPCDTASEYCMSTGGGFSTPSFCAQLPRKGDDDDLDGDPSNNNFISYALGVNVSRERDSKGWPVEFSHNGEHIGYKAEFRASPKSGMAIVLMANTSGCLNDSCSLGASSLFGLIIRGFKNNLGWDNF
jgi:CubicO group peptidase (beta-lactamase class C family)